MLAAAAVGTRETRTTCADGSSKPALTAQCLRSPIWWWQLLPQLDTSCQLSCVSVQQPVHASGPDQQPPPTSAQQRFLPEAPETLFIHCACVRCSTPGTAPTNSCRQWHLLPHASVCRGLHLGPCATHTWHAGAVPVPSTATVVAGALLTACYDGWGSAKVCIYSSSSSNNIQIVMRSQPRGR